MCERWAGSGAVAGRDKTRGRHRRPVGNGVAVMQLVFVLGRQRALKASAGRLGYILTLNG